AEVVELGEQLVALVGDLTFERVQRRGQLGDGTVLELARARDPARRAQRVELVGERVVAEVVGWAGRAVGGPEQAVAEHVAQLVGELGRPLRAPAGALSRGEGRGAA